MVNRFSSMASIINLTVKGGALSCEVPTNKLGINVLRLLRNNGYIWGFNFVSPEKRRHRLYPRVKIWFKYRDKKTPILKAFRLFKATKSNFHIFRKNRIHTILTHNKLYLLSSNNGLQISSLGNLLQSKIASKKHLVPGKILAEIFI